MSDILLSVIEQYAKVSLRLIKDLKAYKAKAEALEAQLAEAQAVPPAATPFVSTGTLGRHSEHLGYILGELQYLQRRYPGGVW